MQKLWLCLLAGASLVFSAVGLDFTPARQAINTAISNHVMPGAVGAVMDTNGVLYLEAFGNMTYGLEAPLGPDEPVTTDTLFDLASLTKVTTTTSCIATFYQRGEVALNWHVDDARLLGSSYSANGKGAITLKNLLLHNAGYPPDPVPDYWATAFACPATGEQHPGEVFSCSEQIFTSLLNQSLIYPTGSEYIYSDLSFITVHYIVGTLALNLGYITEQDFIPSCTAALNGASESQRPGLWKSCAYEAYARKHVFEVVGMPNTGFLPDKSVWPSTMPTWNDTIYRHFWVQGQVSDENSYALGGIAGHAGVFSNAPDLLKLVQRLVWATPTGDGFLNSTTVRLWTTAQNLTQSSRALGWDTNAWGVNTYRGCGNMSTVTFTHTGYTGTQICADVSRGLVTILLTNRCYPNKTGGLDTIHPTRQAWNNAIVAAWDDHYGVGPSY